MSVVIPCLTTCSGRAGGSGRKAVDSQGQRQCRKSAKLKEQKYRNKQHETVILFAKRRVSLKGTSRLLILSWLVEVMARSMLYDASDSLSQTSIYLSLVGFFLEYLGEEMKHWVRLYFAKNSGGFLGY